MTDPRSDAPRVLMTADPAGGVWTYAMELARGLARHDIEVVLATMGAPMRDEQRAEAAAIPRLIVRESRYRLEWMEEPWDDVHAAGEWLLELEREYKPDVVHLNGYAHGALPWSAPVIVAAHSCMLSWWRTVHGVGAPPEWSRYAARISAGLHAADLVVAPTHAMLHALAEHYGPLRAAEVIHNGRTHDYTAPAPKMPFVLGAGRLWDEARGARLLADVAPQLSWPVVLAGDAHASDGEPVELANVEAPGRATPDALADYCARAAIYALPARYEPFGLSILEAALASCALVLGDIPSLRELWGGAALFVPPREPGALRDAITALIEHAALRDHLGAAARQRALLYSAERMTAEYLSAYARLLTRAARSRSIAPAFT